MVVVVATSVLTSRVTGLIYALLSTAVVSLLTLAEAHGYNPPNYFTPLTTLVVYAGGFFMTAGLSYLAVEMRQASSQMVEASDEARRAVENRYAEIVRTAPDGIMLVDERGTVLSGNPAVLQLLGLSEPEVVGQHLSSLPGLGEHVLVAPPAGAAAVAVRLKRRDGTERYVEVDTRDVILNGQACFRLSLRDETARMDAERARDVATAALRQSQRMESIGLLAGGVAHDFNNLLTVIMGAADALQSQVEHLPEARAEATEVKAAALRAADLTRQLLAFSRRQVLSPRNISVNDVVTRAQSMLRRLLPENITVDATLESEALVCADPGQLEQVLVNLAVNARDAMARGGRLHFSTRDVVHAGDGMVPAARYVVLATSDSGDGIAPEVMERLFDPFFTTKAPGAGTGLGLSVVDGIVRQSGGQVRVNSVPGQGATFEVWLPALAHGNKDVLVNTNTAQQLRGEGTILLAEDEEPVRRVVGRILRSAGYQVLEASDGQEAVEMAEAYQGVLALVVSDVTMPRLGGPESVQRIRGQRPGLPALFVSGYGDAAGLASSGADPINRHVAKPLQPSVLLATVRDMVTAPA